jgi:hypothetical protein
MIKADKSRLKKHFRITRAFTLPEKKEVFTMAE